MAVSKKRIQDMTATGDGNRKLCGSVYQWSYIWNWKVGKYEFQTFYDINILDMLVYHLITRNFAISTFILSG